MKNMVKFDSGMRDFFDPLAMAVIELDGLIVAAKQEVPFRHAVNVSSVATLLTQYFFDQLREWLPQEMESWKGMNKTYNPHSGILTVESRI